MDTDTWLRVYITLGKDVEEFIHQFYQYTVLLFQGVFAFKKSKRKMQTDATSLSTLDSWGQDEEPDIKEVTYKNYKCCWKTVTQTLNVSVF